MKKIALFCAVAVFTSAIIIPSNAFADRDVTVSGTPKPILSKALEPQPTPTLSVTPAVPLQNTPLPTASPTPINTSTPTSSIQPQITPTSLPPTTTPISSPNPSPSPIPAPFPLPELAANIPMETYQITPGTGYVDVLINTTKKTKILILTPSGEKIWRKPAFRGTLYYNRIWLTQGTGKYEVSVMENLYDRTYSYLKSLEISNSIYLDKYVLPSNEIESDSPEIISLAKTITEGATTDSEKSLRIYDWISKNIVYDLPKYVRMGRNDYSMNFGALNTLQTRKGVCYDYSTLYAALGRAAGLRVKVIAGNYRSKYGKMYHAWNEVNISETGQWIPLDASMAFIYKKNFYNTLDYVNTYEKTEDL